MDIREYRGHRPESVTASWTRRRGWGASGKEVAKRWPGAARFLASAFLPVGYPDSVTADYAAFQVWDTVQAICSYVRGMLSTKALLEGIGVGEDTATPLGATFQWFLRDVSGMLAGVSFALLQGSSFDARAKQWRLFADCANNVGLLLHLAAPVVPELFMLLACLGSICHALTGVAAGASRMALTQHFARRGNSADIASKEGSQETVTTLVGMVVGMGLTKATSDSVPLLWASFLLLTALHVFSNVRAVRALRLTSLNAERARLVVEEYLEEAEVLDPTEANKRESLLPLRSSPGPRVVMGARVSQLLAGSGGGDADAVLAALVRAAQGEGLPYIVYVPEGGREVRVVLHRARDGPEEQLQAYVHALVVSWFLTEADYTGDAARAQGMGAAWMAAEWGGLCQELQEGGWDLRHVLLGAGEWRAEWS